MSIAIPDALQHRAHQLSLPLALVKRAESISMAEPQNLTAATILGALSPVASGVYAGAKSDSFGQGLRGAGSTVLGALLGGVAGGATGLGAGALLGGLADSSEGRAAGAGLGQLIGSAAGGMFGGGYFSRRSAKKYNSKLERYRQHQKSLAGPTVNVYNSDSRRETPRDEEEEKAARWFSKLTNRVVQAPGPPPLPVGNQVTGQAKGLWAQHKTPIIAGATGVGAGELHGQIAGDIRGQHKGVAKATNYYENMPAWQHMLMGLSGLVGQQGALVDYGLGRAHKKQQQGGFWERMVGPDFLELQSRTRDMRKANPNPMQQRIASWFQ